MSDLPECMKVLIKEEEKRSYVYKEIPVPQPGNGELLVKVLKVSICGSDNILYDWNEGINAIDHFSDACSFYCCLISLCLWSKKA